MTNNYPDLYYATQVSFKLERYKVVSTTPVRINFRCHICGDSKKSKVKARGWLLENKNHELRFFCHNCGASQTFPKFLKTIDPVTYNNYIVDKFSGRSQTTFEKSTLEKTKFVKPVFEKNPLSKIKKVTDLAENHPVREYIGKRKIPKKQIEKLFYAPKFIEWINSIIPNKFDKEKVKDEPRLILPFLDKTGTLFGLSARSFNPKGLRYITIMIDENMPKIFGLNTVDFTKQYYVVEGAIDSLFLNNAIAMAGADGNMSGLEHSENCTVVFDNEPRNVEIHKRMEKIIRAGYKICIWPSNILQKDINEMWLSGITNVEEIIQKNTYSGLEATLALSAWRKK